MVWLGPGSLKSSPSIASWASRKGSPMYLDSRLDRSTRLPPPPLSEPVCDSHQRLGARPLDDCSSFIDMLAMGDKAG